MANVSVVWTEGIQKWCVSRCDLPKIDKFPPRSHLRQDSKEMLRRAWRRDVQTIRLAKIPQKKVRVVKVGFSNDSEIS